MHSTLRACAMSVVFLVYYVYNHTLLQDYMPHAKARLDMIKASQIFSVIFTSSYSVAGQVVSF